MIGGSDNQLRPLLTDIVTRVCGDDQALAGDVDIMRAISVDSLATVQLTIAINNAFDINFGAEDGDLDALESIVALTALVEQRLLGKA